LDQHTPDKDLIKFLQKGDLEAFDQIFQRYGDRLYGFAVKVLKSEEEAEELVQDVFLKIWEKRKNLKEEDTLRTYLFTIAYHNMCRLFRRRNYQERLIKELNDFKSEQIINDENTDYQSVMEQVDKLIDQLPPRQKDVFIKSKKEGKSSKEIAAELNITPGTVDNHVSAALKYLRKNIGNKLPVLLFFSIFLESVTRIKTF